MQPQEDRKVQDNIYGFIDFQRKIWKFIDTPEFQKLRYIKQLGSLYQIFPGATHTRFQHSLGTAHLARTFLQNLIKNHDDNTELYKDQKVQEQALFTVTLAGLMHDVGHGPFSHTFDNSVITTLVDPVKPGQQAKKWKHQLGSEIIFRNIAKRLGENYIKQPQVQRVVRLINHKCTEQDQRPWQFQLISNKITGIDVDKLDYFRRDAYYLGAKGIHINNQLLMREARLLKNDEGKYTICYPLKYALQVNQIFFARYKLYRTYYLNNKAKGIEFMILDALRLVEPIFKFNQICKNIKKGNQNIQQYVKLTDSILERIQLYDEQSPIFTKDEKEGTILLNNLKKAKQLLQMIKIRKIYKFIRQVKTSIDEKNYKINKQQLDRVFNEVNIKQYIVKKTGNNQIKDKFHVAIIDIGYGLKETNPLNEVNFFRKQMKIKQIIKKDKLKGQDISILYTKSFAQRHAKLYVKYQVADRDIYLINKYFLEYFEQNLTQNQSNVKQENKIVVNHVNFGQTLFYLRDLINVEAFGQVINQVINDLPGQNND